MTIQPLPIAAMNQPENVNSLGLSSSSGSLNLFLLSYNWENIEDDEEIKMAAKELISDIDEAARARGIGNDFKYLNYAAGWQNPLGGYGEDKLVKFMTPKVYFRHYVKGDSRFLMPRNSGG